MAEVRPKNECEVETRPPPAEEQADSPHASSLPLSDRLRSTLLIRYLAVALCAALLVTAVRDCLARYTAGETKATLADRHTGSEEFVSMTVCPAFDFAYRRALLRRSGTDVGRYRGGDYSTASAKEPRTFYSEATHELDQILESVTVFTARRGAKGKLDIPLDPSTTNSSFALWTLKPYHLYGDCFSLDLGPEITKLSVAKIEFLSPMGIYVFFHYPGQYLAVDSMTKIEGLIGYSMSAELSYEIFKDTLGHGSVYPCTPGDGEWLDECLYEQIPRKLMEEFGCTVPYLPASPLKSLKQQPVCDADNATLVKMAFEKYYSLISDRHVLLCPRPCVSLSPLINSNITSPWGGNGGGNKRAQTVVSFKSTVKVSKKVLAFPLSSALAEIGQYTGLLLGVSLVRVAVGVIDLALEEARRK